MNDAPSSASNIADGTAKNTTQTISQVKPAPPWVASVPRPSIPTNVQTRKKKMSERPKCFCSLAFSAATSGATTVALAVLDA
ncbi:hypothetical protein [uncultured Jatrophihabitans sp.]|uniref:hypothetical protein n=1 Tax=uncultured Jatrophihabitans sp. TaxID=1610747 RepID=UPI0035C9AC05